MKNKDILEVVQIKIKLKDKEIILSSDEARQVATELNKIFLQQPEKSELQKLQEEWNELKKKTPQPVYVPQPIWIEPWERGPYYPWKIGEPIWLVDRDILPIYSSPTKAPLPNLPETTCLSIDLTK